VPDIWDNYEVMAAIEILQGLDEDALTEAIAILTKTKRTDTVELERVWIRFCEEAIKAAADICALSERLMNRG